MPARCQNSIIFSHCVVVHLSAWRTVSLQFQVMSMRGDVRIYTAKFAASTASGRSASDQSLSISGAHGVFCACNIAGDQSRLLPGAWSTAICLGRLKVKVTVDRVLIDGTIPGERHMCRVRLYPTDQLCRPGQHSASRHISTALGKVYQFRAIELHGTVRERKTSSSATVFMHLLPRTACTASLSLSP